MVFILFSTCLFSDIPDLSPEELRLEAYMAIQQNTLDQYVSLFSSVF